MVEHPYWDLYSKLTALRNTPVGDAKTPVANLAKEAGLNAKEQMKVGFIMALPFSKVRWVEETFFLTLREHYAYAVLSPEILEKIAEYSPIIELGAGNGYNAWVLQQMGAEVVAVDAFPVEEGKNWFFNTRFGLPTKAGKSFTKIEQGDSRSLVKFPNHTLLMCWPPRNPMALESLTDFPGNTLIFVGNKSCCADKAFYKKLGEEWKLEHSTKTGSWDACHTEWLEIHSRIR